MEAAESQVRFLAPASNPETTAKTELALLHESISKAADLHHTSSLLLGAGFRMHGSRLDQHGEATGNQRNHAKISESR